MQTRQLRNVGAADTSVWIAHLREGEQHLGDLLEQGSVTCHPFIIGELACGNLKNRREVPQLLEAIPRIDILEHTEVMSSIQWSVRTPRCVSETEPTAAGMFPDSSTSHLSMRIKNGRIRRRLRSCRWFSNA